jgi:hypothetical protein
LTRNRVLVLILGPLPIVGVSLAVNGLLRPEPRIEASTNDVVHQVQAVAMVAEAAPQPAAPARPGRAIHFEKPCSETAGRLKKNLGDGCEVISRPPFVIAGDLSDKELDRWHRQTIDPAAKAMGNSYFRRAPSEPITVLLFTREESYNRYAHDLFGDNGISVYGYYKPHLRTLVMNISTGGGTLVHELTHALVDFDYPAVPDWFNEGLASLHEQCTFRDGNKGPWIEGLVNWRLPGLQEAIRKQRLRSLETLIEANDFRGDLEGTNYAQARYFCMYLQEQELLPDFYRALRSSGKHDPLGLQATKKLFPDLEWSEIDRKFQAWVMTLKYEP